MLYARQYFSMPAGTSPTTIDESVYVGRQGEMDLAFSLRRTRNHREDQHRFDLNMISMTIINYRSNASGKKAYR